MLSSRQEQCKVDERIYPPTPDKCCWFQLADAERSLMTVTGPALARDASREPSTRRGFRVPATLVAAGAALILIAWVSAVLPWWTIYMMDPDEGINLGKAALVARGVPPYGAMWNDQPPVLTYLLAALQWPFPHDVGAARALILAMAGLLVFSLYRICHRAGGHPAALAAVLLLGASQLFVELSASVMIGLPAIALAVVAFDVASSRLSPPPLRAVLAGMVMALSLQTKLFTFTALPALLLMVWVSAEGPAFERLKALAAFVVGLAAAFLAVVVLSGEPFFEQLVGTHLSSSVRKSYNLVGSFGRIWEVLAQHLPLVVAAGLGAVLGLRWRWRQGLVPLTWLFVATVSLAGHQPIWDHQILLLIVPLAWLAGIGWGVALLRHRPLLLPALPVAALVVWAGWSSLVAPRPEIAYFAAGGQRAVEQFSKFAELGNIVATDVPLDAFRAGLVVPPELAVFSMKRVMQAGITQQELIATLEGYKPVQAQFRRFPVEAPVQDYLDRNYWRVPGTDGPPHYIRKGAALAGFDREAAIAGLTGMLERLIATSVEGGYAGLVNPATGTRYERASNQPPLAARAITMRPVGSTPRMAQCLLRTSDLSGNADLRQAAVRAGEAVVCAQSVEGGWSDAPLLQPNCPAVRPPEAPMVTNNADSLDEGGPAQTIALLLALRQIDPSQGDRFVASARAALDFLVNAQNRDGGWPLKLTDWTYYRYSTLNDGVTTDAIGALVKGFEIFGDPSYRDAALKGVQFLLDMQAENGAWAQQYDATGKPAKARAFEPVAHASLETGRAMQTIADFYALTGSDTLKLSLLTARDWLAARRLGDEGWARLYEIGTDRPVFGDRDDSVHYDISEISKERAEGYRWIEVFPEVELAMDMAAAAEKAADAVPHARVRAERDARVLRIVANREALVAFSASRGVGAELDANGMISTRKAVETCEMVLEALETSGF
jgi:PelA/Pel-15E family pectate lyase